MYQEWVTNRFVHHLFEFVSNKRRSGTPLKGLFALVGCPVPMAEAMGLGDHLPVRVICRVDERKAEAIGYTVAVLLFGDGAVVCFMVVPRRPITSRYMTLINRRQMPTYRMFH